MNSSLEIIKAIPEWKNALKKFLEVIEENGDTAFFFPHPNNDETLDVITQATNKDLYYLLVEGKTVLGYGLLRGWQEGYETPSLGIAISPAARGQGFAKMLIQFLHTTALRRGATKVRLRVLKNNLKALKLYVELGYIFEQDQINEQFLVGYKTIA